MRAFGIIASGALLLAPPAANAAMFYSNLGNPGSLYNCCVGPWPGIGGGPPPIGPYTKGYAFTPSLGGVIGQIDLPFWGYASAAASITLNADSNGSPGAVLDSWSVVPSGINWTTCCTLDTLIPNGPDSLTAGSRYWIVGAPDKNQFTFAGFFLNNIGATGLFAVSGNGGPFVVTQGETLAAFDVIGNPVPEGNTFLLAALGLAGYLMGFQKRRG